jgi:hypothetical protein
MVGMNLYTYGDPPADTGARQIAEWEAWMRQRFPATPET